MTYRKKPVAIEATQWFKNGDHPKEGTETFREGCLMNIFEVKTEYEDENGKIITTNQYVTSEENTLKSVTDYFTVHCDQYREELKAVQCVAVIVQHIKNEN